MKTCRVCRAPLPAWTYGHGRRWRGPRSVCSLSCKGVRSGVARRTLGRVFDGAVLEHFASGPIAPCVVIQRLHADWGGSEVAVARRFWRALARLVKRRRVVRSAAEDGDGRSVRYRAKEARC